MEITLYLRGNILWSALTGWDFDAEPLCLDRPRGGATGAGDLVSVLKANFNNHNTEVNIHVSTSIIRHLYSLSAGFLKWICAKNIMSRLEVTFNYIYMYLHFRSNPLWIFRFLQPFIASWITQFWLTAAKLTCPCNTHRTSNSFDRSDTGIVIDSGPHQSHVQSKPLVCSIGCLCSSCLFRFSILHSN